MYVSKKEQMQVLIEALNTIDSYFTKFCEVPQDDEEDQIFEEAYQKRLLEISKKKSHEVD